MTSPAAPMTSAALVKSFALAGRARLTFRSVKTGTRFTFKVTAKEGKPAFVALMTGSDNESDFEYLGCIYDAKTFAHGRKSRIAPDAPSAKAFAWVWAQIQKGALPESLEVWHEGRCGRCGRVLTVPESIETGLGPECVKHVH